MIASKVPRYLLAAAAVGVAVTLIMLSVFYAQYRSLAREIVTTSAADYETLLAASFERRARARLHDVADKLLAGTDAGDTITIVNRLEQAIADRAGLDGLVFEGVNGIRAGAGVAVPDGGAVVWLDEYLALRYPVMVNDSTVGQLGGVFLLDPLELESEAFAAQLALQEQESLRASFVWIGLGAMFTLIVCAATVISLARLQNRRIHLLQTEARKLSEADFGQRLPEDSDDALGQLASIFNEMRDKLRKTTLSRDYVDSILSSMNDSIIVTSEDGRIKRVNRATSALLGYEEAELLGKSLDVIIDAKRTGSLIGDSTSGVPKEAFFKTASDESVPVSYTCSILEGI